MSEKLKITRGSGRFRKRIASKRLVPLFERGRIWFPDAFYVINCEGRSENLAEVFVEQEYLAFQGSFRFPPLAAIDSPSAARQNPPEGEGTCVR